jgi:hypothetical protein
MKIVFKKEAYLKLQAYVAGIDYEISGFGKVEKEGGNLVITDIRIFPQVVTPAHTEMDAKNLAKFWDSLIVAGEDLGKWKLWWHSHVRMGASFSGTDDDTIDDFDSEMPENNWMLSIVTNKMGDLYAQIDVFEPIRCVIKHLIWSVEYGEQHFEIDVSQEIREKVTVSYPPSSHSKITIKFPDLRHKFNLKKDANVHILTPEEKLNLLKKYPDLQKTETLFHFPDYIEN